MAEPRIAARFAQGDESGATVEIAVIAVHDGTEVVELYVRGDSVLLTFDEARLVAAHLVALADELAGRK